MKTLLTALIFLTFMTSIAFTNNVIIQAESNSFVITEGPVVIKTDSTCYFWSWGTGKVASFDSGNVQVSIRCRADFDPTQPGPAWLRVTLPDSSIFTLYVETDTMSTISVNINYVTSGTWEFSYINDTQERNLIIDYINFDWNPAPSIPAVYPLTWVITGNDVNLAWDLNTENDMAKYKIYINAVLIDSIEHPAVLIYLPLNTLFNSYYQVFEFNLTAADTAGNESVFSNTVSGIFCQEDDKLFCDINADSKVTNIDHALLLWQLGTIIANIVDPELRAKLEEYDFDGNGKIESIDLAYLIPCLGNKK